MLWVYVRGYGLGTQAKDDLVTFFLWKKKSSPFVRFLSGEYLWNFLQAFQANRWIDELMDWWILKLMDDDVFPLAIGSMYGIFTYMNGWLMFIVNVGKYIIHGSYGSWWWHRWFYHCSISTILSFLMHFVYRKGIRTATIGVLVFEYIYIIVWILDIYIIVWILDIYIIMDHVEY